MLPLNESIIRSSFVNASRREAKDAVLPDFLDAVAWDALDFLGWRDPKFAKRAYVVLPSLDGDPVGVVLRQADAAPRSRAMCSWCRDVRLPNDVVFWSARRVGDAGRRGATVGTLICRDFECSHNVRNDPPPAYEGYDVAAARAQRIDELRLKVAGFADMLVTGR
ncbi:translation elongation factor [Leucobacter sp. OLJS4]|uniref:FBP domain-containing protein n=1 Tax=unclassified Leucobacter TaxID=2621730 RepID=UPI000C19D99C|nr:MULTISPECIES: FBP domain-containing protein [unclassified Leucobacter]PII84525.1 translation elongation factor [Leucobacter sp. OLCALW19]PII88763.1 translation elongation factor [Leucobacter sp. OLTLW20]PII90879.1 translation elongation factor [Leucobacter sp. OLAS13]PII97626.1 translation elongation factor [Leucobacter sp. OLDS2]PII98913.1 translation elongation factor [Leucobacter sp. OLCS4]